MGFAEQKKESMKMIGLLFISRKYLLLRSHQNNPNDKKSTKEDLTPLASGVEKNGIHV